MTDVPTLRDLYRARRSIAPVVRRTPLTVSSALSAHAGGEVHLKLENQQVSGSFKARGAANALLALEPVARARGVVAVSTGNHGRAVALMARRLGIAATVCVSERVPADKLRALRATGCDLRVGGDSQDEAEIAARALVRERGLTLVHPFDDPQVIAGQGTIGLELLEDLPGLELAVVPLSGGGLIAGVAVALKTASPTIRVVGVSMEGGAAMALSLRAGRPVPTDELPTLADSLQGGIGDPNRLTFRVVRDLVDEVVLMDEGAIAGAMRYAFVHEKQVLEGAAAVGIAALLEGRVRAAPGASVVVCSGGNIDPRRFMDIVGAADDVPVAANPESGAS